ncbi:hypothetical protein KYG33_07490 [Chryseobacterium sp. D764]|uniref:hypothetical protein n=1 Tax=unclassified Chryseobacterium TaxID=2593645 RepID=UPI00098582CB|nr:MULTISPECIES: hypothetical protein [unclassified Chryseobacterium]QXU50876.1 hypothetical protein KYG33_07490 [Chryseobacterium sp. D764]CAD0220007.1 conserved membrane protein of unknown function [Chryseobacterium sp. JV274]
MFNIVSYIIFLSISSYVTIDVGRRCYHEGKAYLKYLLHDEGLCLTINRILLGCYYLVNLGFIAINLTIWNKISSLEEMITITATRVGSIILILSMLHYMNIFILYFLRNKLTLK